jgi:MFS family permease
MAGIVLIATTVSGLGAWLVTFLVRVHGLSIAQGGLTVALSVGLLSALGASVASVVIDRIRPRGGDFDPRVSALAAAILTVVTVMLAACAVLVASTAACVAFLLATGLFLAAYNGPANGLFVTLAPAAVRGLAVSILQLWCNLVGMGVGPLIVGRISDRFEPDSGLRWGLLVVLSFSLWGAGHFLVLARRSRARSPAAHCA